MQIIKALAAAGFSLPSPAFIFCALLLLLIGRAAFRYGAAYSREALKWIGAALMICPLAISQTWLLLLAGSVLCLCLYLFRPRAEEPSELLPTPDGE